jgi:hypothetical protein
MSLDILCYIVSDLKIEMSHYKYEASNGFQEKSEKIFSVKNNIIYSEITY